MAENFKGMWEQVLLAAVREAKEGPSKQEIDDYIFTVRRDALLWVEGTTTGPGSFLWVCDLLGLEPSAVRKQVLRGKKPGA